MKIITTLLILFCLLVGCATYDKCLNVYKTKPRQKALYLAGDSVLLGWSCGYSYGSATVEEAIDNAYNRCLQERAQRNISFPCLLYAVNDSIGYDEARQEFNALERERHDRCIQGNCTNGQGTFTFANGDKYVGEYKNGNKHGQGTYAWANGDKYVGEFKDGEINGQGTFTLPNGDKYVGEFKDDEYNGQGTHTLPDGSKYVGEFKDNEYNGQGTFTYADGRIQHGIWENDEFVQAIITSYTGTGFAVSRDGLIVTACHLVQEATSIKIHLHDGSLVHAKIHAKDPVNDIAILKLNTPTPNFLSVAPLNSAKTGNRVFTIGFPMSTILGREAKYTEGVISSLSGIEGTPSFFQITVPIQPGNSGGALVNEDGYVVGIISSSAAISTFLTNAGTLPQNVNWAVKADYLRPLIDLPKSTSTKVTRQEIIEQTKKASFLIETVN